MYLLLATDSDLGHVLLIDLLVGQIWVQVIWLPSSQELVSSFKLSSSIVTGGLNELNSLIRKLGHC